MPLVDKIEYTLQRGHHFKIFNGETEYTNNATGINTTECSVVFSDGTTEYNATAVADDALSGYGVTYFFMTSESSDFVSNSDMGFTRVTITFEQPIPATSISIKSNINGAVNKPSNAKVDIYYKNVVIAHDEIYYQNPPEIFTTNIQAYSYFIKSLNNYYTIANEQLTQVVDTSAGGITDLSLITPVLLQGLTQPKLVVTSEGEIPSDVVLSTQVKLQPQTIVQKTDVDIQTAEELSNIIVTHSGTAIVRISCSIDSGMSWIKYDGSSWVTTELSEGMDIDTIQGLTAEQLDYLVQSNKLRFAFYIAPQTIDDNIVLQNIKFSMKKEGLWTSCILNTDYTYGRGTDFIEFTAKKAGDYLINYTE